MNTLGKAVLVLSALFLSAAAQAQQGLYVGANVSQLTYKEDGTPSAKPTTFGFKIGSRFNPNLAVEARLGAGMSDDTVTVQGVPVKLEVDNYYGAYLKGIWPASDMFSAYLLVGYTRGEVTASAQGASVSDSDSDFSYGIGAEFAVTKAISLNLEWARLFKGSDYKVDGLSFGVNYKF